MRLTKDKIKKLVNVYGKSTLRPTDDFNFVSVSMNNNRYGPDQNYYYSTKYELIFTQSAIHRPEETTAVRENVAKSIHDLIYGDILRSLYEIKLSCTIGSRDAIIEMLETLISQING